MGESQAVKYFKRFVVTIVRVLGEEYLRSSNAQDTTRLGEYNKKSMIGEKKVCS
jgi:hypothetical protein